MAVVSAFQNMWFFETRNSKYNSKYLDTCHVQHMPEAELPVADTLFFNILNHSKDYHFLHRD